MKKIIHKQAGFCLILFLILISMEPLIAQTTQMVVHKTDGTELVIPVADILEMTFDGVTGIEDLNKLAAAFHLFELLKTYPNPVRTETCAEYRLEDSGRVRILIFNQQGVLIKELLNQVQPAGTHRIEWNANGINGGKVKSGIYLLTVQFNNQVHSQRLVVID